ncbi:MAG: hypothetical protein MI749_13615 [Desulfovibrionales bacterium]|nr:hypothetical protein [Desulfovibrionales bacterium]
MLDYYKFKEVSELFLTGKTREAKLRLQELQTKYISLCDEVSTLKQQVSEFDDILHLSQNLLFDGNYYWLKTGTVRHGPFCATCCKEEGLLIRLPHGGGKKLCWRCGKQYGVTSPQPSSQPKQLGKVIPLRPALSQDSTEEYFDQANHD